MKNTRGAQALLLLLLPFSERHAATQPSQNGWWPSELSLVLPHWGKQTARAMPLGDSGTTQHMLVKTSGHLSGARCWGWSRQGDPSLGGCTSVWQLAVWAAAGGPLIIVCPWSSGHVLAHRKEAPGERGFSGLPDHQNK